MKMLSRFFNKRKVKKSDLTRKRAIRKGGKMHRQFYHQPSNEWVWWYLIMIDGQYIDESFDIDLPPINSNQSFDSHRMENIENSSSNIDYFVEFESKKGVDYFDSSINDDVSSGSFSHDELPASTGFTSNSSFNDSSSSSYDSSSSFGSSSSSYDSGSSYSGGSSSSFD